MSDDEEKQAKLRRLRETLNSPSTGEGAHADSVPPLPRSDDQTTNADLMMKQLATKADLERLKTLINQETRI